MKDAPDLITEKYLLDLGVLYPRLINREFKPWGRDVKIAVTNANYGEATAAIIEFEGCPPHNTVLLSFYKGYARYKEIATLVISGQMIRKSAKKKKAVDIIISFLEDSGNIQKDKSRNSNKNQVKQ